MDHQGRGVCRLGHTCVRRLRKSCGPECGWPCWLTPPCAAVSWRRRQALLPPACPSAALQPPDVLMQGIQTPCLLTQSAYPGHLGRQMRAFTGPSHSLHPPLSFLTWPHAVQALEEELSMAAGSQRSMHSASFTSADGGSMRSQGSFPRQPPGHPPHGLGKSAQPSTFSFYVHPCVSTAGDITQP